MQPRCFKLTYHISPRPHSTIKALEDVSEEDAVNQEGVSFQGGKIVFEDLLADVYLSVVPYIKAENCEAFGGRMERDKAQLLPLIGRS